MQPVDRAIKIAIRFGGLTKAPQKSWVIDQMVRALTGDSYEKTIAAAKAGSESFAPYEWDRGEAPGNGPPQLLGRIGRILREASNDATG